MLSIKTLIPLVLLVSVGVAVVDCQKKSRRPSKFLVPQGYVGWVQIDYDVQGASPITTENDAAIFKFLADGRIKTTGQIEYGWAKDEYYYYSGDTLRELKLGEADHGGMIWAHGNGSVGQGPKAKVYERFFVGTESDYQAEEIKLRPTGEPSIGPLKSKN